MPKLQNNNRTPIKPNDANTSRSNSYINETKVAKDYRAPSNYTTILNGISNITNHLNDKLQDFTLKAQQIESENKFNEFQTELNNRTKEYKFNYERNPSEDLTKDYETDIQNLKDDYEKQMPSLYKNNFLQRVDQINKSLNLDFFRKVADLNYQSNKYMESLNQSLNTVNKASYEGNNDIIATAVAQLPTIKHQLNILYGETEGNKHYNNYTRNLIKNYIEGRLASNNPDDVINISKIIEASPEFEDKLTAEELENYKAQAIDKKNKLEKTRKTQEEVEYAIKTNSIVNAITNQQLTNYGDIVNSLVTMNASEYESKMVMKYAGYSTNLPPELLDKNKEEQRNIRTISKRIDDKELNRKKSNLEKNQYSVNIQEQIFSLFEGIVNEDGNHNKDKALKKVNNRSTVANKIKNIETMLLEGLASNYITGAEYNNFTNQLLPYYTQILDATAKGNFDDDNWHSFSIGYDDLKKEIEKILESNNLNINPDKLKGIDYERYYFLKNNIMSNFIKSMEIQFEEIKKSNLKSEYVNINNWIDFQNIVDKDTRKKMYNRAIAEATAKYAQNELNIDITPLLDKNTGQITNLDLLLQTMQQKAEDVNVMDLMYDMTK